MENELFGICRVEKYRKGDVTGIQRHDRREAEKSKSNLEIDYSRTHLNYDLHNSNNEISFSKKVKELISRLKLKRKLRYDASVMCQFMCGASPDFFKDKSAEQIKSYFVDCYNFLSNKYGKENIVSAIVHLDETSPHMHFNFVPITPDNRLSARDMFTPQTLTELQTEMHTQVFSKYGLSRGETKEDKRKHYSTQVYKVLTLERKIDEKKHELSVLENQLSNNELYQQKQYIKSLQHKLSQMFDVLESNPKLLQEYKKAIQEMQKSKQEKEL